MTIEQKRELLPTIELMMGMTSKSRSDGLLSLDELVPYIESPLVFIGLRLIIDGIAIESLKQILQNYIDADSDRLTDIELLKLKVECVCLMELQTGCSPSMMRDAALSVMGTDIATEVYSAMNRYQPYTKTGRELENLNALELMGEPKDIDEELEYLIEMTSLDLLSKTLFIMDTYSIDILLHNISIKSRKKLYFSKPEESRTLFVQSNLLRMSYSQGTIVDVRDDFKLLLSKRLSWSPEIGLPKKVEDLPVQVRNEP